METIIVACNMIKDEVDKALRETGCEYPIIWVDDSLHMYPSKLKEQLQKEIIKIENENNHVDHIIFAFGYCGNCFIGIESGKASLVIPRMNDCIEMLIGDTIENPSSLGCYFLTRGWLESEKAIPKEYDFYIQRYGEKRAKRIMDVLLANYKSMMLIDTEAYNVEKYTDEARAFAERLNLDFVQEKGSIRILKKLFEGNWDDEFCIIPPHTTINFNQLGESNMLNFRC